MEINSDVLPPSYSVDLQMVSERENYSSCTRLLASNLINNPYITPGQFITELSNYELDWLIETTEKLTIENEGLYDDDEDVDELIIITLMLSQAEGVSVIDESQLFDHIKLMTLMLVGTKLGRDGVVKLFPEKFSFGQDMRDEIIFEPIKDPEDDQ